MTLITIWHNPRCSKSRETLALLDGKGDITVRRYLDAPPNEEELRNTLKLLGITAKEMMRVKEKKFKELGLTINDPEERLIGAMAQNPILIERPIVFTGSKAAIGRPPETVLTLF